MSRLLASAIAISLCIPLSATAQSNSAKPIPVLHTSSRLVVEDVVVTDAQQHPIHQLSPSDFTILEDGHPQTIKVFEEHQAGGPAPVPPLPRFAPGKFTNYSPAPANGALNVLLLDKLNTPMSAQAVVRDQILKYLKHTPAGTRIAIFGLTTQLRLLQGFTSDPALLRSLIEGKRTLPGNSPLLANSLSADGTGASSLMDTAGDALGNSPDAAMVADSLQQFEAQQQSFQFTLRAQYTLDAFNQLARYLSALPGRKNLIWFSGSFPISVLPDADQQDPFAAVSSSEDEFRSTVNLLARSQVAVYPIDARGLMTEPMLSAANSGRALVRNPSAMNKAEEQFFQQTNSEHGTMTQMAEATGGKAFVDTNDLTASIAKAIEAGSNYYTIAYSPTDKDQDGDFRRIDIKLDRPGAKLAYRRGYYAEEPASSGHHKQDQNVAASPSPDSPIRVAMMHGAPDPDQIVFIADVRPTTSSTESSAAPGNQPAPGLSGPFRRYTVTFVLNPGDLDCAAMPDGDHHCLIEFASYVYNANGALMNTQTNGINAAIPPARYASFLKGPFAYRQQISVPAKGEYFLRLGLSDDTANHLGALELSVADLAKVTPASAPAPASAVPPSK